MDISKLVIANNQFGFDLLAHLSEEGSDQNCFISPASISQALCMTNNGASDKTAAGLARVLRLTGMKRTQVNQAQSTLWQALAKVDPKVQLRAANSLWAEPAFPFAASFLASVLDHYTAEISTVDFSQPVKAAATINSWVEEKTEGKIKDLLSAGDLHLAVLVLVNAIYFKGLWRQPFDPANTKKGSFTLASGTSRPQQMMFQMGQYHYLREDTFQMISLPFGQGQLSMVVLLPDKAQPLQELLSQLNGQNWRNWTSRLVPYQTDKASQWDPRWLSDGTSPGSITLPRFKIRFHTSLLQKLRIMGFDANEFPHMSMRNEALAISKVIHETFLEVNEEGAEAAAATAVVTIRAAVASPPPFEMVIDRPFFCTIQDNLTRTILFMGTIFDPQ